jgi:arylsulfatase A-like enzyme
MGARGERTVVMLTSDHGRSRDFKNHGGGYPESARVWLVAAGAGITARGPIDAPVPRYLADIAPTMRKLLGLPRDEGPRAGAPLLELTGGGA